MDEPARPSAPGVESPTLALIAVTYVAWVGAGLWLWPRSAPAALAAMTVLAALHASLTHEAVHGHPTRWAWLNELLACWPLGLVWPYRRFRALHLAHHRCARLTDPDLDPESAYQAPARYRSLPAWRRRLLDWNATLAGRLLLGPVLGAGALLAADAARLRAGERAVAVAWLLHAGALLAVACAVGLGFGIPLWLYAVTVAWGAQSLMCLRTYAEHRWHEAPQARTAIVERTPLAWLYLHNNLHVVHHRHPGVPWYRLPALYRARREQWLACNRGYVLPGYGALLRAHALRAKEPVEHPCPQPAGPRGSA